MENKYYTPNIKEFHIGFEFEMFIDNMNDWVNGTISPFSFTCKNNLHQKENEFDKILYYLRKDKIRVKYLDKKDIESLGFKMVCNDSSSLTFSNKAHEKFNIIKDSIILDLFTNTKVGNYISIVYSETKSILFRGNIKNKSELNILLIQLKLIN